MTSPELTDSVITQGRALVQAVEALGTVDIQDPFERAVAELFQAAYERRLMEIVESTPPWIAEQILSAFEHAEDLPPALRMTCDGAALPH
jgi:hypothetical protein